MGASDYMVGDPGRYAVPQVGQQLGQALADLPEAYMKGREMKRARSMQDMFSGGLPQNEDGSTNWTAALQKYLQEGSKIGGGQFVGQYVPQLLDEEMGRNAAAISRGEPIGPSAFFGPAPGQASAAAGPGNIQQSPQAQGVPQGQQQQPAGQPQQSGPRFRQLAASYRLGKDAIDSLGRVLKIDPEKTLSPQEVVAVRRAIEEELPRQGRGATSEVNQPAEGTSAADDGMNAGSRPPFMGGGASGAPAPAGERAPNAVAQAGPGMAGVDNAGAGGTSGGSPGLRPTPVGTESEARMKERSATNKEAAAAYLSKRNPTGSKDLMEQAQADRKRASEIRASLGEYNKPTPVEMNAQNPLVQAQKIEDETRKADIEVSKKTMKGLQEAGVAGQTGNDKLDVIRTQMSNPDFFSGAGSDLVKKFQQWSVSLGGNPRAAEPMEEFHKTTLDLLNEQIRSMTASGMSRIQLAEINNLKQSIASLGISPASNRYLAEELYRVHKSNIEIADLARQYERQHKYLDSGWEAVRAQYYKDHPLFNAREIADPRLIAPPYLPLATNGDPAKKAQWARNQGIKKGEPYLADGPDPRLPPGPDNVRHLRAW